jgi:hypothetical protein
MEVIGVIVGIFVALVLLGLVLGILGKFIQGAAIIFGYASEQGFIGLAICLACFVFMFPVMAIVSVIIGFWVGNSED